MSLDTLGLYLIEAIYALYGLFSFYYAYIIAIKKEFRIVNGVDDNTILRIKQTRRFARDYALPHFLVGLTSIVSVILAIIDGPLVLLVATVVTVAVCWYGTSMTRKLPERLRRGYYM